MLESIVCSGQWFGCSLPLFSALRGLSSKAGRVAARVTRIRYQDTVRSSGAAEATRNAAKDIWRGNLGPHLIQKHGPDPAQRVGHARMPWPRRRGPGSPRLLQVRSGLVEPPQPVARGPGAVRGARGVLPAAVGEHGARSAMHGEGLVRPAQAVVSQAKIPKGSPDVRMHRSPGDERSVEKSPVGFKRLGISPVLQELQTDNAISIFVLGRSPSLRCLRHPFAKWCVDWSLKLKKAIVHNLGSLFR